MNGLLLHQRLGQIAMRMRGRRQARRPFGRHWNFRRGGGEVQVLAEQIDELDVDVCELLGGR